RLRGRHQGSEGRWDTMRALPYRAFCPYYSCRVSLWYLSAGLRYTTLCAHAGGGSLPAPGRAAVGTVGRREAAWRRHVRNVRVLPVAETQGGRNGPLCDVCSAVSLYPAPDRGGTGGVCDANDPVRWSD